MNNLEFLKKYQLRTICIKATECVEKTDYTINLMIAHPDWTYLQETYLQEKLGLETYFKEFPNAKPTEDRVEEIFKENIKKPVKKLEFIEDEEELA